MRQTAFYLHSFKFFAKTIKAFVMLTSNNKFSDWDLCDNIFFFIEYCVETVLFAGLKYMMKGRRRTLTFEDLKNALNLILDTNSFTNRMSFYKKIKTKYSFFSDYYKFRRNASFRQTDVSENHLCYVFQAWIYKNIKKNSKLETKINTTKFLKTANDRYNTKSKATVNIVSLSPLTKKQQSFYKYFTMIFERGNEFEQNACLEIISEDNGISFLIPYMILYLTQFFSSKKQMITKIKLAIKFILAIILNNFHNVQPFIHQILPMLLQCLIGKQAVANRNETHDVRYLCAKIIAYIFQRSGQKNASLQSKIVFLLTKNLLNSFNNIDDLFGAIIGLAMIGIHSFELYLIPFLDLIINKIELEYDVKQYHITITSSAKYLLDLIINITASYLIQRHSQILMFRHSDLFVGSNLEKIYNLFPRLKKLKKDYVDT